MTTTLGPTPENCERGEVISDTERIIEDVTSQANREIRLGLTRRVYSQLTVQMLTIFIFEVVVFYVDPVYIFIRDHDWPLGFAVALWLLIIIPLYILRKVKPINLILLAVYTVSQACVFVQLRMHFESGVMLETLFYMIAVFVGLTLFTFHTRRDFTFSDSVLFTGVCVVVTGGIMHPIIEESMLELAICAAATFTISVFIIFDTQAITKTMLPEDYTFATVQLYLDFFLWPCLKLRLVASKR